MKFVNDMKGWYRNYQQRQQYRLKDMPVFLQRLSLLIREGYCFADAIMMLLPHHMEQARKKQIEIEEQLYNGEGVMRVMQVIGVPRAYLISISIAEHHGCLQEALSAIAKQMQFAEGMKKRLQKLLIYPVALLCFLVVLFVVFRTYFFPNIERMIVARGGSTESGSLVVSKILLYVPDLGVGMTIMTVTLSLLTRYVLRTKNIAVQVRLLLRFPLFGFYYRLLLTSAFTKHLGSLLMSGFSLQASLEVLERQAFQLKLQYCACLLREFVMQGDSLACAMNKMGMFQKDVATFAEHGEKSGYLGKELVLYSELLETQFEERLQRLLSVVQPTFFVLVAICIVAAYLSILLPIYSMIEFV